ncbi:nucleotidyltransferase family protein [Brevibacterium daeguense]|uniref:Nucleotidyltransferase family protein n=1 Tax=Brevibacterium daeguense TaxID=909936 RepID=A0ABP8EHA9_9MICO
MPVAGLLLAAGGGRRLGMPKGLLVDADGMPRIARVCEQMRAAGCSPIVVVLGASAEEVASLLPDHAQAVVAEDWEHGMSSSLTVGLSALTAGSGSSNVRGTGTDPAAEAPAELPAAEAPAELPAAALVMLVDLPDVDENAMTRVIECGFEAFPEVENALVRATWDSEPGHPVLLGRVHWSAAIRSAVGDQGARALLDGAGVFTVECGDLGTGLDVDRPEDLEGTPR